MTGTETRTILMVVHPGRGEADAAVHADRTGVGRVTDHGDQLAHAHGLGSGGQFGQQGSPPALALGLGGHVDRVFCGKAIGGPRLEPIAIREAHHPALVLHDQVGQPFGQHVGAPCGHVGFTWRIDLESTRAVQHMVGIEGGDGGHVGFGAGADDGHENRKWL